MSHPYSFARNDQMNYAFFTVGSSFKSSPWGFDFSIDAIEPIINPDTK